MIISLRGTNGAGKSTIVRKIMDMYAKRVPVMQEGRRKPLGYVCSGFRYQRRGSKHLGSLFVPGHYEIANGGVDTLTSLDEAYTMIKRNANAGNHVLYEGKNMTDGPLRLIDLKKQGYDTRAVLISYPLEDCVAAVRARGHSIREKSIEQLYRKSFANALVLEEAGVRVCRLTRDEVLDRVKYWLGE